MARELRAGGSWDIKTQFEPYTWFSQSRQGLAEVHVYGVRNDVFGNIHYGAVMKAAGFSRQAAEWIAGRGRRTVPICGLGLRCEEVVVDFGIQTPMDNFFTRVGYRLDTSSEATTFATLVNQFRRNAARWYQRSIDTEDEAIERIVIPV